MVGCSGHPQNKSNDEWNAMTPAQQFVAFEQQRRIDKYKADEKRCRGESDRTIKVKISGGGMSAPNSFGTNLGEIEIHQGENLDTYGLCMKHAGWDTELHLREQN
jgi:hypothetical protein